METEYEGKILNIQDKDNWTYAGVSSNKIKDLNEELFSKVQKHVEYYIENKEKIEREQKLKKIEILYKEQKMKFETFKEEITRLYGERLKDYKIKFFEPNKKEHFYQMKNYNEKRLEIQHIEIEFDPDVYDYGSGYFSTKHKASKPWTLREHFKTTRYKTVDNAIESAIKRVNKKIEQNKIKKQEQERNEFIESEFKKYAEENGFKYEKQFKSSRFRHGGYYEHVMTKEGSYGKMIKCFLSYNDENSCVRISKYTVWTTGKHTLDIDDVLRL